MTERPPLRFFLDFEFDNESNYRVIELISIGIVCEDGREYYACNSEYDLKKASPWLEENVLPYLPPKHPVPPSSGGSPRLWEESFAWKPQDQIAVEVAAFFKDFNIGDGFTPMHPILPGLLRGLPAKMFPRRFRQWSSYAQMIFEYDQRRFKPEIWCDYGAYDWVLLCQLFGGMIHIPPGMPWWFHELQQLSERLGNPELPKQESTEHHALADARENQRKYLFLTEYAQKID